MSSELPCISMNLTRRERYSSGIQSPSRPALRPGRTRGTPVLRVSTAGLPTERSLASSIMATRRDELTREAARLFAERGFHGTSMGDLAEALGVQKGSLYSLTGSKQELLSRRCGGAHARSTLRSTPCPRTRPRSSASGSRCAATSAWSRSSSTSRPSSPASGATSRATAARRSSPSAAATRSAGARCSARASSRATSAPTSTRRRDAARPLGGELGVHLARAGARHRRARRPLHRDPRRRRSRLRDPG